MSTFNTNTYFCCNTCGEVNNYSKDYQPLFITRRCIITLSGGHKVQATLSIPQPRKPLFMEQLEEQFIKEFNRSQPHAVNKAVKVHIMRN